MQLRRMTFGLISRVDIHFVGDLRTSDEDTITSHHSLASLVAAYHFAYRRCTHALTPTVRDFRLFIFLIRFDF